MGENDSTNDVDTDNDDYHDRAVIKLIIITKIPGNFFSLSPRGLSEGG